MRVEHVNLHMTNFYSLTHVFINNYLLLYYYQVPMVTPVNLYNNLYTQKFEYKIKFG